MKKNVFLKRRYVYFLFPIIGTLPIIRYGIFNFPEIQFVIHYFRIAMIIFGVLFWSLYDGGSKRLLYYLILSFIVLGFEYRAMATVSILI